MNAPQLRRARALAAAVAFSFAFAGGFQPARGEPLAAEPAATTTAGDLTHLVYTATHGLTASLVSPAERQTVTSELTKVAVVTVAGAGVELVVGGAAVPATQLGSRSADAKTASTLYTFYGVRFVPGPNAVEVTALGADGLRGETTRSVVFGSGKPAALSGGLSGTLRADGITPAVLTVHALDAWHHAARAGSMLRVSVRAGGLKLLAALPPAVGSAGLPPAAPATALDVAVGPDGDARLFVVPGTTSGDAAIAFSSGDARGETGIFVRPFLRKALLVGLFSVGAGAAPGSRDGEDHLDAGGSRLSRAALFVTGESLPGVATTIAYDTASRLSSSAALGPFVDDPGEDPYRTYGDSSVQRSDVLSKDRLYARLEAGRDAFTYGRFTAETGSAQSGSVSAFQAVLSGARLDLADSTGRFHVTAFTARNDVAYGRVVLEATGLSTFGGDLKPDIIVGSEIVTLDALDPRTGAVVSETTLQRNVDYVLDTQSGTLRFIEVPLPYDTSFHPQVVVVRYQYAAAGNGSRTTGGRIGATFGGGLGELNVGYVNDATGSGSFTLLQQNLRLATRLGSFDFAHVASAGAVPGSALDSTGQTWHAAYAGQRGGTKLVASYDRAGVGFTDPFGGLTANGLTDARAALTQTLRRGGELTLSFDSQRDALSGSAQSDASVTLRRPLSRRLTVESGLDLRHASGGSAPATATAQARVSAAYDVNSRTTVRAQRIANIGGSASATQPGETTVSIDSRIGNATRLFVRQLWDDTPQQTFASNAVAPAAGSTRRTTIGIEEKVGAGTTVSSEYTAEHTAAGSSLTSALGVRQTLVLSKQIRGSAFVQTGSARATGGTADSANAGFTAYGVDLSLATARFRATTSLQERAGALGGSTLALGAAGALSPDVSLVGDLRSAQNAGFHDTQARVGLAWRPHGNDRGAAVLELDRHAGLLAANGEHVDTLAVEAAWRATSRLELDARGALKLDGDGTYAAHTYLAGVRAVQRVGSRFDVGAEARLRGAAGTSAPLHGELAVESGLRIGDAMRFAAGYNVTGATDPELAGRPTRKGLYVTFTSVVSHVFGWGR